MSYGHNTVLQNYLHEFSDFKWEENTEAVQKLD